MAGGAIKANFKKKDHYILVDLKFRKKREWNDFLFNLFKPIRKHKTPVLSHQRNKAKTYSNNKSERKELRKRIKLLEDQLFEIGKRINKAEKENAEDPTKLTCPEKKKKQKKNKEKSDSSNSKSQRSQSCEPSRSNNQVNTRQKSNCNVTCRNILIDDQNLKVDINSNTSKQLDESKPNNEKIQKQTQQEPCKQTENTDKGNSNPKQNSSEIDQKNVCVNNEQQHNKIYFAQDVQTDGLQKKSNEKNNIEELASMKRIKVLIDDAVSVSVVKALENYFKGALPVKDKVLSPPCDELPINNPMKNAQDFKNKNYEKPEEMNNAFFKNNLQTNEFEADIISSDSHIGREEAQMSGLNSSTHICSVFVGEAIVEEKNDDVFNKFKNNTLSTKRCREITNDLSSPLINSLQKTNIGSPKINSDKPDCGQLQSISKCPSIKLFIDGKGSNLVGDRIPSQKGFILKALRKEANHYTSSYIKKKFVKNSNKIKTEIKERTNMGGS